MCCQLIAISEMPDTNPVWPINDPSLVLLTSHLIDSVH